jgi:hypothetical protein
MRNYLTESVDGRVPPPFPVPDVLGHILGGYRQRKEQPLNHINPNRSEVTVEAAPPPVSRRR